MIKIQIELKNKEEIEALVSGLEMAARDARNYFNACTPETKEDKQILSYWDRRAELLDRVGKDIIKQIEL